LPFIDILQVDKRVISGKEFLIRKPHVRTLTVSYLYKFAFKCTYRDQRSQVCNCNKLSKTRSKKK